MSQQRKDDEQTKDTDDQHRADVVNMAKRLALVYHYLTKTLKEELGRQETRRLLERAIWRYGEHVGKKTRERAEEMGLKPTLSNFSAASDLPSRGWESTVKEASSDEHRSVVEYCPFAEVWNEIGDPDLARVYCLVDQAKYRAYDARLQCEHVHNQLDGDDYCEIYVRKMQDVEDPHTPDETHSMN